MSYRRLCKAVAAAAVAIGLTAGTVTANANDITLFGGGGGNAGGGMPTGSGQMYMTWRYQDNNDGGFGPATDTNSVRKALELDWTTITGNADQWISEATAEANTNCVNRFNEAHPGETASCRVVAVGAVGETNRRFGYPAGAAHYIWMDAWNQIVAPGEYYNNGKGYRTNYEFDDQPGWSVDRIADEYAPDWVNGASTGSIVVIALNQYEPANPAYDLKITTSQQAGSIQVGATDAVHDVIHASGGDGEQVTANVILHYKGNKYVQSASKSKSVNITTNGDTNSPDFTPADFGWEHWQAGTYWFDVQVARQGNMSDAVDTADEEASETFRVTAVPPEAPDKKIEEGVSADAMTNRTTITTRTGAGGYEMTIKDVIDPNGIAYTVDNYKLIDKTDDNKDISGQFTIGWDQASNTVTAVRSADQGEMPIDHEWEFSFDVTVSLPDDWQNVKDEGFVQWNDEPEVSTGSKEFPTWKPNPDKSWIKMGADGTWQAVIDPDETNTTGADTQTFLDGDKVASVVNGTVAADLIEAPETLSLEDDWTAADYLFDADAENIRVYAAEATSDRESSVSNITNTGKDITDQFTITIDESGTKAVATAKKEYLKTLKGLSKPLQLTLLIPGVVNFANGKGAEQVRADFGKQPGEELTFCADPAVSQNPDDTTLTNAGAQTVNGQREETNEPYICGYLPPVVKDVLAEGSEGGDQESVDGEIVFPGQKVEYQLLTTPQLPADMAYSVTEVAVTDTYSQYLEIDRQTLEITDLNTGKTIGKSKYATTWDDENHTLRIVFDADYVHDNWQPGSNPRILIRFEGTVSKDAPADTKVDNQWGLTLNNSLTPSNKVKNLPPDITPGKEDTQKDPSIDIDGKTALLGDTIYYRIHVDASKLTDTAYKVWRLGMVDDYDEEYLRLDRRGIQITDETGKDVTSQFNIADVDGVAYAFAKTVDTYVDATGETIPGDPQPDDLKAYSELKDEDHDPLTDPAIDQTLLGHTYTVVLPMTVIKVTDGYVVSNTATQVTNGKRDVTNTVSNPVKPISPSKDVTVSVGGDSVNGGSIYKDHMFLYQLDSSILPADRAYQTITDWTGTDQLDTEHDRYTGQWAVYATRDLYKDGTVIAQAGERIAGSDFDGSKFGGDLFTVEAGDNGLITVAATQTYLDLVSADNAHEAGWRLYLQVERTAVADRVENTWTETINHEPRESNVVWTKTPDMTPSLKIEKWDTASGFESGDRDSTDQALKMDGDSTEITFTITNTSGVDPDTGDGAWFKASDLDLSDSLIVGSGTIDMDSLEYPDNWDTLVLKPGESVDVKGTLSGVQAGDVHTDRAIVTGVPLVACPTDTDDPFGGDETEDDDETADTVDIDGTVLCEDTIVTSNTDDWNGYRAKPLASTGAAIVVAALIGLGLLMTGVTMIYTVRRRVDAGRHVHLSA